MLDIEVKEDSPEKLAAIAGKPTKNFLFAQEVNNMVEAINVVVEQVPNKADLIGGKVPAEQLPSYVDDVLEFANLAAFPVTGETSKIYLALDTNFTYRWSGSAYVKISDIGKLDKVTSSGVERVYTINTDGSQGTKSISELSVPFDIIKNYPNQILIQASGNAVNYVGTYAQTITGTQSDLLIGGGGVSYRKVLSTTTAGSSINFYDAGIYRITGTKGFYYRARIKNDDPTNIPTARFSYGLCGTALIGNINPSAYVQAMLSFGADNSDSNCQIMYKNAGGTATKIDLGSTMPKSASDEYVIEFWRIEGTTTVHYKVTNLTTSAVVQNTFVYAFTGLALGCFRNNDIATTAVSFAVRRIELYIND